MKKNEPSPLELLKAKSAPEMNRVKRISSSESSSDRDVMNETRLDKDDVRHESRKDRFCPILALGTLNKRRAGPIRSGLSERLFVLTQHALFYMKFAKDVSDFLGSKRGMILLKHVQSVDVKEPSKEKSNLPVLTIRMKEGEEIYKFDFTMSSEKSTNLYAPDDEEDPLRYLRKWQRAITDAMQTRRAFVSSDQARMQLFCDKNTKSKSYIDDRNLSLPPLPSEPPASPTTKTSTNRDTPSRNDSGDAIRATRREVGCAIVTICVAVLYGTSSKSTPTTMMALIGNWGLLFALVLWLTSSVAPTRLPSTTSSSSIHSFTSQTRGVVEMASATKSVEDRGECGNIFKPPTRRRDVSPRRMSTAGRQLGFSLKVRIDPSIDRALVPAHSEPTVTNDLGKFEEIKNDDGDDDDDDGDNSNESAKKPKRRRLSRSGDSNCIRDEISRKNTYYAPTHGTSVRLRIGPDYTKNKKKDFGAPAMYSCVSCDWIHPYENEGQFHNIGMLLRERGLFEFRDHASVAGWCPPSKLGDKDDSKVVDIALPRTIIVQLILPRDAPQMWGGPADDDVDSQSLVICFHIKAETIADILRGKEAPPDVKLLSRFAKEAANKESKFVRSRFKSVFKLTSEDFHKLGIGMAESYNGKPIMLRRTIQCYTSPSKVCGRNRFLYDYLEIDIHVTRWDYLKKYLLHNMRSTVADVQVLLGFLIEGVKNDELPERLFGAVRVNNIKMGGSRAFP
eukprot:g4583.t1